MKIINGLSAKKLACRDNVILPDYEPFDDNGEWYKN